MRYYILIAFRLIAGMRVFLSSIHRRTSRGSHTSNRLIILSDLMLLVCFANVNNKFGNKKAPYFYGAFFSSVLKNYFVKMDLPA